MLETEGDKGCIKDIYGAHSDLVCSWEIVLAEDAAGPFPGSGSQSLVISTAAAFMIIQVTFAFWKV